MRDLRVADLASGADAGHFGLTPIDVVRVQKAQADVGCGRSFVDVAPRAGLAILGPLGGHATFDFTDSDRIGGIGGVPLPQ